MSYKLQSEKRKVHTGLLKIVILTEIPRIKPITNTNMSFSWSDRSIMGKKHKHKNLNNGKRR